jgi:hypothetical protein
MFLVFNCVDSHVKDSVAKLSIPLSGEQGGEGGGGRQKGGRREEMGGKM